MVYDSYMKKLWYVAAVAAIFSVAVTSLAYASHSWGDYHWARSANPLLLRLGDNVSSVWDPFLISVSTDWNSSTVLNTNVVAGGSNPKNCRATNGRVEVCNSKYGKNGWLGIAQVWVSGSHITQGTVKLNDTYFSTAKYTSSAWRQFVMCQEIGHAFGLDHQDEAFNNSNLGTCMDYTDNPARNDGVGDNQRPNAHDYEQLIAIYGHYDVLSAIINSPASASASATVSDIDFSNPSTWGKAIKNDTSGRSSLHVRDLSKGQKLFTFVVWAE
jgi:hypothetical protein